MLRTGGRATRCAARHERREVLQSLRRAPDVSDGLLRGGGLEGEGRVTRLPDSWMEEGGNWRLESTCSRGRNLAPPLTPARARAHSVGQLATPGITTRRGSVGQLATPGAHAPGRGSVLALRRAGRELHELAPSDAARARAPCSSNAARARERRAGSASSARRDGGSRGLTRATGTRATASSRPSDAVRARAPCSSNAARARECHEDTARPRCAQHDDASSDGSENLRIERRSESVGSEPACRQGRRQNKQPTGMRTASTRSRTRGWMRGKLE